MKFENEFKKQIVPEWADAYVDYNGLKRLLREVSCERQIKKSRVPFRRSKKKPTVNGKCRELTSQPRKCQIVKDIENQVGVVDRSLQNDHLQLSKSCSHGKFQEISEIEMAFLRKFDEELIKVNSFYKENVEAVTEEASVLSKQRKTLVALRRKMEITPLNERHDSHNEASTIPLSSTFQTPCPSGSVHLDSAVETDANYRHEQKESHWGSELDEVHTEVSSNKHVEEVTTMENSQDSQEILKHVKVVDVFNSRKSTSKDICKSSKDDDLDVDQDDRSKIEEQLKKAFAEFYQKLQSLKQYSFMNLSAFARIMNKYEKISSKAAAKSYMETVDNSYLGSSDEVADLMKMVEITFIKDFSNSNYAEAMKHLRPKTKREKHSVTFSSGFLSGCTVALFVATVLKIASQKLMEREEGTHYMENIFPLYSLFGFVVLHMLMYATDLYFWRRCRVNYPFIFGFKRGTALGWQEVFLLSTGFAVLASASFLANLYLDRDPSTQKYRTEAEKVPLGTTALILLITFCPFNILYKSSRFFFIRCLLRCISAPLCKVKFPDYFLADQLTSQVQASRCIVLYICYYGLGEYSRKQNKCHTRGVYNTLSFIIAVVPFWLRFLQCMRRLLEEKDWMHGYNALKYLSTIVAVLVRTACELRKGATWMVLALISSVVAVLVNTYWDIVVDWGLLRKHSKNKYLRDRLLVSNKSVYFAAMILNILLRIAWIQLVLAFNLRSFQKVAATVLISCLEIIRRGLWNFFSLENEHLNNVNKYRSFKSVPLPFSYSDDDDEKDN
ncbi:phosphate transporter PHO1-like protein 10 [Cucumis melo var. makuwa]|uniref:Phosphate transporter PHO1-like protein 10 n=1 Tax=Cucumis melo var. makuwa TaxID=1194695 RepID=A0A5D3D1H5_CUCMM|nr:phosphate transporter PHO1-like protein 10 [Cucumis melo var. makuwa]